MQETCHQDFQHPLTCGVSTARLGIIGGGQLARMLAMAALPLGCQVSILQSSIPDSADPLRHRVVTGDWSDAGTLHAFASRVDVVSLENEFVDSGALRSLEEAGHKVYPRSHCMALTQDKLFQKQALEKAGLSVPRFFAVASPGQLAEAGDRLGWPLVLKARRNGYDGRGNFTLRSATDIPKAWLALGGGPLMVEAFWPFSKELAVIVTRGLDGEVVTYPVVETVQENHVCKLVLAPASISPALASQARELALRAVAAVDGVGSFGVELFLSTEGQLAVNELAPRVHNSGHYTMDACVCSQFENHVRAVLGWPLGDPSMIAPAAAMLNLLGTQAGSGRPHGMADALSVPGAHVHLYGKAGCAPGRKMGHVNALGSTRDEALTRVLKAGRAITFI